MEQELISTWKVIAWIASSIILLGGAITILINWKNKKKKPHEDLKIQVDSNTKRLEKHDRILDRDNQRFLTSEEGQKVTIRCLLALTDHELTGNSVDKLRTAKTELTNYLINR